MLHLLKIAVALFAVVGSGLQVYPSLRQMKEVDPSGHRTFFAVDGLKTEISPMRHPVEWSRRRLQVRELLRESPGEARLYYRVRSQLLSWLVLMFTAALATVVAVVDV